MQQPHEAPFRQVLSDLVTWKAPAAEAAQAGIDGGERLMLIEVEAFDWNCSQHIPQRFGAVEIAAMIRPFEARIAQLEARLRAAGIEPPPPPQGEHHEVV